MREERRPPDPEGILGAILRFLGACLGIAAVAPALAFGLGYLAGIKSPRGFSDILSWLSLVLFLMGALSLFGGARWRTYITTSYGASVEETPAFGRFRRATRDLWGSIRFSLGAFLIGAIFMGIAVYLYFHTST